MEGTRIEIEKSDGFMSIIVDGHNQDPITCAGVSAIMQTCELGLKALAESRKNVKIIELTEE